MPKLIATVNFWSDSKEWLIEHCENLRACGVDFILVLSQITSNTGVKDNSGHSLVLELRQNRVIDDFILFIPNLSISASANEKAKRNKGLSYAKDNGFDYLIMTDTDEFYKPNEFKIAYEYLQRQDYIKGLVFHLYTYYKRRTLRTENFDGYHVTGIFKIEPSLMLGVKSKYLIDPTRKLCYGIGVVGVIDLFEGCPMHHYSWIREDIKKKIESSSAKENIKRNKMYEEYLKLDAGSVINGNKLIEV